MRRLFPKSRAFGKEIWARFMTQVHRSTYGVMLRVAGQDHARDGRRDKVRMGTIRLDRQ